MLSEIQQLAVGKNTVDRANGWLTLPARGACDPQTSGAGPSATGTCLALQKVSLQTNVPSARFCRVYDLDFAFPFRPND